MKILITTFFFLFTFLFGIAPHQFASQNFDISSDIHYLVDDNGKVSATQNIKIINKTKFIHSPSYTITLNVEGIEEMQVTTETGASIPFTVNDTENGGKNIKVVFPDRTVGKGSSHEFSLKYKTTTLVHKLGNSWEVNIPGIKSDEFTSSQVSVTVPQNMGEATLIKPENGVHQSGTTYIFPSDTLKEAGALLIFGDTEYYRFQLTYKLENANFFPLRTEIALPPTTAYQDIILDDISPRPQRIYTDHDGNYLAEFTLDPQEEKIVKADVLVKVTAAPNKSQELSASDEKKYIQGQRYWEQSRQIQDLAQKLTTPEKIYEFLVTDFTYNHARTADVSTRLGAKQALNQKDNMVCLEFTDLFVALARSAGIPARSVEGYAYTQNPSVRPRALVQDVLHAWPEYYDKGEKKWIMVDPTWGNTTAGIDYFHTMDLSHIAFVRKGEDSQYPIPAGGYKTEETDKQVEVSFATPEEFEKEEKVTISASLKKITNPFSRAEALIAIHNTGNTPIISKTLSVSDQNGSSREILISNIPPLGTQEVAFTLGSSALTKEEHLLTMQLEDQVVTSRLTSGVEPGSILAITGGGIFGALILGLSVKGGSLYFQRRRK